MDHGKEYFTDSPHILNFVEAHERIEVARFTFLTSGAQLRFGVEIPAHHFGEVLVIIPGDNHFLRRAAVVDHDFFGDGVRWFTLNRSSPFVEPEKIQMGDPLMKWMTWGQIVGRN